MSGAVLNTQGFGNRPENVEVPVYSNRIPSSSDVDYPLGKRWITAYTNQEYVLTSKSSYGGQVQAIWTLLSSSFSISAVGTATLSSGSVTVSNSLCLSTSVVMASRISSVNSSDIAISSITNGSFTISSFSGTDASEMAYMIVN